MLPCEGMDPGQSSVMNERVEHRVLDGWVVL